MYPTRTTAKAEPKRRILPFSGIAILALAVGAQTPVLPQTSDSHKPQVTVARVPFVGCQSDGQVGPLAAPRGKSKNVAISAEAAKRLAYYKAQDTPGTLAPRGWYCLGTYGSNGGNLYVSPEPIAKTDVFSDKWKGFEGPAIQISDRAGDTSGRFDVARIIARVFPAHREFVESVIDEGIEPASAFPFGHYPKDNLTYRSDKVVEFQTPANTKGLGTDSSLRANGEPISGVAILSGEELSLTQLWMRLPADAIDLGPAITEQVERDTVRGKE
jgi:hypothetical protein